MYIEGPNSGLKGDNGVKRMSGEKRRCQSVGRMFDGNRPWGYCLHETHGGMRKWKSGDGRPGASSCAFSGLKVAVS